MLGYLYGYYNGYISIYYQPLTKKTQNYTMAPPSFDWWMQWCRGRPVQRRAQPLCFPATKTRGAELQWKSTYEDHIGIMYTIYICVPVHMYIYIYHLSYNSIEK